MKAYLHFISGTDGFNLVVEVGETVGSGQKILYICALLLVWETD